MSAAPLALAQLSGPVTVPGSVLIAFAVFVVAGSLLAVWAGHRGLARIRAEQLAFDHRGNRSRAGGVSDREHWQQAEADTSAESGRLDSSARAGGSFDPRAFTPEVLP